MVAPGPQPPRDGRSASLAGALRVVYAGPRYLYRAALVSLAGTCLLTIAISMDVRPAGRLRLPQQELLELALAGLLGVGVLVLAAVVWPATRRAAVLDRLAAPEQRAAVWLALALWFPLLVVVAYYRAKSTLPSSVVWISFGYLDKRWVSACYLVAALAPMLLVVASARVLAAGRAQPESWRAWLSGLAPARRTAGQAAADARPERAGAEHAAPSNWWGARWLSVAVGVLTALGLAYYFYGPPWYLNRTAGAAPIGVQEDVFLTGLQAISRGATPYIGPAAVQYGPGTQLLSYFFMRHIGTFSVVGFRESWAMFEWAGASIFFVVLFLALGYGRGLAATLMAALIYPALRLVGFGLHGHAYSGFFGWANPLRYAGAISLILLLPAVIRRAPSWRGLTGAAVLGLLWGGLSYVAQENLVAGAIGAVAVSALLLLSGTATWRSVWTSLLAVVGGFVIIWLPVLAYYAAKGLLVRFLYLYFLITRAVAEGYSNTLYGGAHPNSIEVHNNLPWQMFFYDLPLVLASLALLAVVQFRPFRIAMEWSRERIMIVAMLLTTILLYQGALLRSDADHLTGTLLVMPALVVTIASLLPRLVGARRRVTIVLAGAALVAASFVLLPAHTYQPSSLRAQAAAPYRDRQRQAAEPAPPQLTTLAAQRVGAGLSDVRQCCQRGREGMGQFITLMNRIHLIIGDRTTYVVGFPGGYTGAVYFVADLKPAPVPLDLKTMVFTTAQRRAYMSNFRAKVLPRTQALVTIHLRVPEVWAFLRRYPHAKKIILAYHGQPYYVLLAS